MKNVIVYVDGFNLYFGLKDKGWKRYYWLNIQELAKNLLKEDEQLVFTKYFTSRISSPPDKHRRQSVFIEALQTLRDFSIYYGKYQLNPQICRRCGFLDHIPNEKMSDVNIAVELLTDAFLNKFDTAILISADSDLTAPILAVRRLFPEKQVIAAFPPERSSKQLKKVATAYTHIGRDKIAGSVFPAEIQKPDGYVLRCPYEWK